MTAEVFLDANVLLYACSNAPEDSQKQRLAQQLAAGRPAVECEGQGALVERQADAAELIAAIGRRVRQAERVPGDGLAGQQVGDGAHHLRRVGKCCFDQRRHQLGAEC